MYESKLITRSGAARDSGLDVARVIALLGIIVVNYHGYLNGAQALGYNQSNPFLRLLDPWNGILVFSPVVFVVASGIGCALLTNAARESEDTGAVSTMRWVLVRRGVTLLLGGLIFEWIWAGTILPYFGIYFLLAAFIYTWKARAIVTLSLTATLGAAALSWWRFERAVDGYSTTWLSPRWIVTPRDLIFRLFIDYTHPVLPWFTYFCAGLLVGRAWKAFADRRRLIMAACAAVAAVSFTISALALHLSDGLTQHLLSTDPFRRGLLATVAYTAIGVGFIALVLTFVDRLRSNRWVGVAQRVGASTLTMYVLHAFVYNAVVNWWSWIDPTGFDVAALFGLITWTCLVIIAIIWTNRFGRAPLEYVLRRIGG
ncbi:MAG: DUF418 domain-containing protein [Actinomycetota bacterium]